LLRFGVSGLREYAVIAAFHDSRFTPIDASELSQLRCDISLLTQFEARPTGAILDWTIGMHGIQIDFSDPLTHRQYNATFLPEVAQEQGWSHEETIEELVHKSGYRGTLTAQLKQRIQLTRYQSEKATLKYEEYMVLREKITNGHSVNIAMASKSTFTSTDLKHKLSNGSSSRVPIQQDDDGDAVDGADGSDDSPPPVQQQKRSKLTPTANGNGLHAK
jgi:hypothetical protein